MSYQALARRWRPRQFADVVGQESTVTALTAALTQDRVHHAFLFAGTRGVGKTTLARLLAKALNCDGGVSAEPCSKCDACIAVDEGRYVDLIEVDAASRTRVDDTRELLDNVQYAPTMGRFKVYLIDEVHMLTTPAFNALLRTLEAPPAHGKFIFCTTDVHKVPATIISRCQRFDFKRISLQVISDRLKSVVKAENIIIEKESLASISRKADGSMRDALSLLDQVVSFCGSSVLHEDVVIALGLIPQDLYFDFTRSIREKNNELMITLLSKFTSFGISAAEVLNGIGEHIRNLLYAGVKNGQELLEMNQEYRKLYVQESAEWDKRDLIRVGQALGDVSAYIRQAEDPYMLLEMTAFKLLE